MKKIYQIPETNVLRVETQQMIAQSQGGVATGDGLGEAYDPNAPSYSRNSGSVWDDEE